MAYADVPRILLTCQYTIHRRLQFVVYCYIVMRPVAEHEI